MHSTQSPSPNDDPCDVVVVAPDAVGVAPGNEALSNLLHQAARYRPDTQTRAAPDFSSGPTAPPVDTTFRPASVDGLASRGGASIARRAIRAFGALLLAACIGLTVVAWKSYGDAAKKKITRMATELVLTSSLSSEKPALPEPAGPAVEAEANANAASAAAPLVQIAPKAAVPAAAASPEAAQLLQSMARDLATVGHEVEQLKASMEQLKSSQQQSLREAATSSKPRAKISASAPQLTAAGMRKRITSMPPPKAAAAALPQVTAPNYVPRPAEPQPQTVAAPELSSVPRPPMPVR
jgi:hypothetical protein